MKKRKNTTIEHLAAADPHIVKKFAAHLVASFEEFINEYPGQVDYIDGLMGAHNFYKAVVRHLVEETGTTVWWNVALTTFAEMVKEEEKKV